MKQICPEQTRELREEFEAMDLDGNGLLDFDEL
jgi:Ca2+-binding EF-hand superfamily protein